MRANLLLLIIAMPLLVIVWIAAFVAGEGWKQ